MTARVARGVKRERERVLLHVRPHLNQLIDESVNKRAVPRNRIGGEDDRITRIDRGVFVVAVDDTRECRHRFALAASA